MFTLGLLKPLLLLTALPVLFWIAIIDVRRGIIPNWCNTVVFLAGLAGAAAGFGPPLSEAVLAALLAALMILLLRHLFFLWRGRTGLGMGDVKFLAAAATWTGLEAMPTLILMASLSGLLCLSARTLLGSAPTADMRIPFGPHLVIGLTYVSIVGSLS